MTNTFNPTHTIADVLAELIYTFPSRVRDEAVGVFCFSDGSASLYPMRAAIELPQVIQVTAYEEPEPLRVAPEVGSTYWFIDYLTLEGVRCLAWADDNLDHRILLAGEARATKEDALAARAARQKARGFA